MYSKRLIKIDKRGPFLWLCGNYNLLEITEKAETLHFPKQENEV